MLQFLVNNTQLTLKPDTKIRYELNSCYFDEEGIPAGKVWHFDVPVADNEETFEYSNYIIVAKKYRVYDCVIKLHSYPIGKGKLVVSLSNAKVFRVQVTLNSFAIDFEKVKLSDAPYEAENIGGDPHDQANVLQHARDVNSKVIDRDYRFPMVYAPNFYGELTDHDNDSNTPDQLEFNKDYAGYINNWTADGFMPNSQEEGNRNTMIPFPLLGRSLKKCLELKNYKLCGALEEDEELSELLMFSNNSMDNFTNSHYAKGGLEAGMLMSYSYKKIMFSKDIEDRENLLFDGFYNVSEPGVYHFEYGLFFDNANVSEIEFGLMFQYLQNDVVIAEIGADPATWFPNMQPIVSSKTMPAEFTSLYRFQNVEFLNTGPIEIKIKAVDSRMDILWSTYFHKMPDETFLLDSSTVSIKKVVGDNPFSGDGNSFKGNIKLSDQLPATPIGEFINSLRNTFFLAAYFNDHTREVGLERMNDVLLNKYKVDLSEHVVYQSEEIIPQEPATFKLAWSEDTPVCDVADSSLDLSYANHAALPAQLPQKTYALLQDIDMVYLYDKYEDEQPPEWRFYAHNYKALKEEEETSWNIDSIFSPMTVIDNGKVYPYFEGMGNSDMIPEETYDIGIRLMFWRGISGRPVAIPGNKIESGLLGQRTLSVKDNNGLMYYGAAWINFLRHKEEFKVQLTDLDLFKLVEIQDLFLPKRRADHPRWVYLKGVKALPKQFTAIFDIKGNIIDSEIVLVKKGEA